MDSTPFYINGRFLSQPITGVQKFALGLSQALIQSGAEVVLLTPANALPTNLEAEHRQIGKYQGQFWEQIELPAYLRKMGNPMLYSFCNSGPLTYPQQFVCIHDLSFLRFPQYFKWHYTAWSRYRTRVLLKNAKEIATVSEFSKSEIYKNYPWFHKEISVIHNGIYFGQAMPDSGFTEIEQPYALFVGGNDPRKGLARLLNVWNDSLPLLVITGRNAGFFHKQQLPADKHIRFIWDIDDARLQALYSGALMLIYPSEYEGFGLPILEAQHLSCPCLVSDLPVFRELFGNSVYYFQTFDSIPGLVRTLQHNDIRQSLILKGKENAGKYRFENALPFHHDSGKRS
jgi:glycosyltransferase involved in cell wall biosynthesis